MDFSTAKRSTINPADLHNYADDDSFNSFYDTFTSGPGPLSDMASIMAADMPSVDSAVDLTAFDTDAWNPLIKQEEAMDQFFTISNTPSPETDLIFSGANSQANSPPELFRRDLSHTSSSSPDTTTASPPLDVKPPLAEDEWKTMFATPNAIHIPQNSPEVNGPRVRLYPDKTKTRAETQIKVQLVMDDLDDRYEFLHFPRQLLAKPKLLASVDEIKEVEAAGESLHLSLFLVCATAIEDEGRHAQALRRARGEEPIPSRERGVVVSEIDKEDPAHPQNGGQVVICEGCRERERKRYDRKKKRAEDEDEWWQNEYERIIMINEKEYKKWKEVDASDPNHAPGAMHVEFAMRIACYCRHQEEKSPVGYKVIFTFKDSQDRTVAQHTSEIFQITDDHKNKEIASDALPSSLTIPQQYVQQYAPHAHNVVPIYQYPSEGQFAQPPGLAAYSQPPTPSVPTFQTPLSPMDAQFHHPSAPNGLPQVPSLAPAQSYPGSTPAPPQAPQHFARHPTHFEAPLSPTGPLKIETQGLPRNVSMDSFNFSSNMGYPHQPFASAPQSAVSTPINLSRPPSPSWEQGPAKKKMMCLFYYVDDE